MTRLLLPLVLSATLSAKAAEPPAALSGEVVRFEDDFARPNWTVFKWKEWHAAGHPGNETVELFNTADLRLPHDAWHRLIVHWRGAQVTFSLPDLGFIQTVTHLEIDVPEMDRLNLGATGTGVQFRRLRITTLPASEK